MARNINFEDTRVKIEQFYKDNIKEEIKWKSPLQAQAILDGIKIQFVFEMLIPSHILWISSEISNLLKTDIQLYLRASAWIRKEAQTRAVILIGTDTFHWLEEDYSIFRVRKIIKKEIGSADFGDPLSPTLKTRTTLLTFDMEKKAEVLEKMLPSIKNDEEITQSTNSLRINATRLFEKVDSPTNTFETSNCLMTFEETSDRRLPMYINSLLPIQYWRKLLESFPLSGRLNKRNVMDHLRNFTSVCKIMISKSLSSTDSWISLLFGIGYNQALLICHELITESPYVKTSN